MLRNESGGEWRVADKRGLRMRVSSGEQHEIRRKLRLSGDWDGRLRERVWGGVCAATAGAGIATTDSSFAAANSSFATAGAGIATTDSSFATTNSVFATAGAGIAAAGAGFATTDSSFAAASSSFAATTVHTGIAAAKRSNAASASSGASASRHD